MFSLELIAGIFWGIMLKERGLPTLYVMTLLTYLFLKLALVRVSMAGRRIAGLKRYTCKLAILMTPVTLNIYMLINKGVFRFGVVGIDLFPTIGCMAFLAFWLIFMRILVTSQAFFKLFNFIFVFDMTLVTLDFYVFTCKWIF
jgi:hypothetical protein